MRSTLTILMMASATVCFAQDPAQLIRGCWQAGDGGMEGEYCFLENGHLKIAPTGRMPLTMQWKWDPKKELLTWRGRGKPIRYSIDILNDTTFVLYEEKEGIRLIGRREP